jgi:nucleoside-diphosphate-sugar epimerase
MATVLVVGGTGATGPETVNGLLRRGYDVTMLHSGLHESGMIGADVEHLHTDTHDLDSLNAALGQRTFDVGIAMYGRLRYVAQALGGRVEQLIAVGGVFYEGWINDQFHTTDDGAVVESPMAPYTYPPMPMREDAPMDTNPNNRFARIALESERLVMQLHDEGRFDATLFRFPKVYGPQAIAPVEWSIVRRVLDGRSRIIVPDGGLILETKAHSTNASTAILAAVDHPSEAEGQIFNVGDDRPVTTREWIYQIASALGHEVEMVTVPFDRAYSSYPYARDPWTICHHVLDLSKLRSRLSWSPPVSVEEGLRETARSLAANPLEIGGESEQQVGDPFDYVMEDRVLAETDRYRGQLAEYTPTFRYSHPYRHPKRNSREK